MNEELSKRQAISRLMREAAFIFSQANSPDITPALPKMYAAVHLAGQLDDKTPLVICEANLASMNAVCGNGPAALEHIERALTVSMERELPLPIKNFACTKFVEIAILLGCERDRALSFARALLHSAAEEENSYSQFFAAVFNLAVVSNDLFSRLEWSLSLLSWIIDEASPQDHPISLQAKRYYDKVASALPESTRLLEISEIEANRDFFLREATMGLLPEYQPRQCETHDWTVGDSDSSGEA